MKMKKKKKEKEKKRLSEAASYVVRAPPSPQPSSCLLPKLHFLREMLFRLSTVGGSKNSPEFSTVQYLAENLPSAHIKQEERFGIKA